MILKKSIIALALNSVFLLLSCKTSASVDVIAPAPDTTDSPRTYRTFETSFEQEADFKEFYTETAANYDSGQELATDIVKDGAKSHKAWIVNARAAHNDGLIYQPHRAYPTIQFHKTASGSFRTPCLVSLWVYLDMNLVDQPTGSIDDWFSFATFSPDSSDNWARTILVNITPDGYVRLVHVPIQGGQTHIYQAGKDAAGNDNDPNGALKFPYKQWVRLDILIDLNAANGYAKVWQDSTLVSYAKVEGGAGLLAQAHFGLYASAAIPSGTIYNDKLRIKEVKDETEALSLVASSW